jgi:AraC-like DNA-binding protein
VPAIPLPIVVSILLIVLLVTVLRREGSASANRPFLALILVSILQTLLAGLRWGYGVEAVMFLAPIGAATVPPLAYAGVTALSGKSRRPPLRRLLLHAVPALAVIGLFATWRGAIDLVLIATFLGYAVAILRLMRPGADALQLTPFETVAPAYRAILFAAFSLIFSAVIDTAVYLDFAFAQGTYVRPVIAIGNLALLGILSVAAAAASRGPPPAEPDRRAPQPVVIEDRETLSAVEALMQGKRAYRDVDLNLDRLARKLGIPARQISTAINRATGKNVSQYVNEHRVAEACRLLETTDRPVTEIMFEAGFQTKSNFNREFRRITGMAPLRWREHRTATSDIAI